MRKRYIVLLLALAALYPRLAGTAGGQKIRPPAVAGTFYPQDPKELGQMVDGFLSRARVPEIKDVVAVISPHAGYVYSGQVAAYSYALLKGRKIDRVVVISPSHYEAFSYASVYDGTAYATPLGEIPVDQDFAKKLAGMSSHIKLSSSGHSISRGQGEHSLEVQLPFLQRVLGQFKLAPIVMGDQSYDTCRALGVALAKLIREPGTLIVASSDLSHFHTYDEAVKLDHKTLKAIEEWDYLSMSRNFERMVWEACGGGPIVATMIAAERLGANQAKVLKYANTGDVTGDRSRVVGYGAVALVKAPSANVSHDGGFALSEQEKNQLLYIARKSVETAVTERKLFECSAAGYEGLAQERGAFVTLKKKGELRGCIGYVAPVKPLCLTVRDVAAMAALNDQRFPPVSTKELSQLEYEISVLSPLRRVLDVKQIVVGRDGLVIKKGPSEGLLLPQVPVEQHWDRTEFLEQTCVKAGLPPRAWRDEDSDIFSFTALVFGEHQPVLEKTKALLKAREPGLLLRSAAQF